MGEPKSPGEDIAGSSGSVTSPTVPVDRWAVGGTPATLSTTRRRGRDRAMGPERREFPTMGPCPISQHSI